MKKGGSAGDEVEVGSPFQEDRKQTLVAETQVEEAGSSEWASGLIKRQSQKTFEGLDMRLREGESGSWGQVQGLWLSTGWIEMPFPGIEESERATYEG